MGGIHSQLQEELEKHLYGIDRCPEELRPFIETINKSYIAWDYDVRMLKRTLNLSSNGLLQANSELRAVLNAFPDMLLRIDRKGRIIECKEDMSKCPHLRADELLGKRLTDLPSKEVTNIFRKAISRVHRCDEVAIEEYVFERDGIEWFYEARFVPLPYGQTMVAIRNISDRRRSEQALIDSARSLANIVCSLPDAAFAIDRQGRVIAWNNAMEELSSVSREMMLGKGDKEYSILFRGKKSPMLVDMVLEPDAEAEKEYLSFERCGETVSGAIFSETIRPGGAHLSGKARPLYDMDGNVVGAIQNLRDVTDLKLAEEDIRESAERLKKQQAALVKLTRSKTLFVQDLSLPLHEITETASETLNAARVSVWLLDQDCGKLLCSELYERDIGRHSSGMELNIPNMTDYVASLDRNRIIGVEDSCNDDRVPEAVKVHLRKAGIVSHLSVPIMINGVAAGIIVHSYDVQRHWAEDEKIFAGSIADITALAMDNCERMKAESLLRTRTTAIDAATDQIMIVDTDERIEFVNPSFARETGYSASELIGASPALLIREDVDSALVSHVRATVFGGDTWHGEFVIRRKDGALVVEELTVTPVKNDLGTIERFICIARNVTEKKVSHERLQHMAHHDDLTGLPNRVSFTDRLADCLSKAKTENSHLAVLFLDLDKFKQVNDNLGHNVGDSLLQAVSKRLQNCVRNADIIARMGGDEFTIILSDISGIEDVEAVTRRAIDALSAPFVLLGHELFVTVSIGVGLYPSDGLDVETLLKNADSAMYKAKEQGRNNYQFYTNSSNSDADERKQIEEGLHCAIERGELLLHYQPRVDVMTGRIVGSEALVRWCHPELGILPPSQFLPIAEETGLIGSIGEWVMLNACAQNKAWQDEGFEPISVSVNTGKLLHSGLVIPLVRGTLLETGLPPEYLELEFTERVIMESLDRVSDALVDLKQMGLRLSIDDYGTGFSSLTYLNHHYIDSIKIDQSFIKNLITDPNDAAVARAVIAMCQSLKLNVIAEGVESIDQVEYLRSLGCNEIQGYLVSKPVTPDKFERFLREHKPFIQAAS